MNKVLLLQAAKANDKGIQMPVKYEGFDFELKDQVRRAKTGLRSPMITLDKMRLMQVLVCLTSNALKFTRAGFVKIQAKIETRFQES